MYRAEKDMDKFSKKLQLYVMIQIGPFYLENIIDLLLYLHFKLKKTKIENKRYGRVKFQGVMLFILTSSFHK